MIWQLAGRDNIRRRAATQIHNHLRCSLDACGGPSRINAALKTVARIRINLQSAAGIGGAHRVEKSRFQKHIRGLIGASRM